MIQTATRLTAPGFRRRWVNPRLVYGMLLVMLTTMVMVVSAAWATTGARCLVPDNGTGTASYPPDCGGYQSPEALIARDGLPAGTVIVSPLALTHVMVLSSGPGGGVGEVQHFQATLALELRGTGTLAGYTRSLSFSVDGHSATNPRMLGHSPQSFDTDLTDLIGQLPPGDPDFDLLRISAGTGFGMPSPGHTTLTRTSGGDWAIDSFFDITYRIDFVGHTGGPLGGMSGSTTSETRMSQGRPERTPCNQADNGAGTIDFPPGCNPGYNDPDPQAVRLNGLPPGIPVTGTLSISNVNPIMHAAGGSLGGMVWKFTANAVIDLVGTGTYSSYRRHVTIPVQGEAHTGPIAPGAVVEHFPTDMVTLFGEVPPGDPDFDLLRITAGTAFGMPSPGHNTLTRLPDGNWAVDSFFDITYRIDFTGAPGGPFAGHSGTSMDAGRFEAGVARCPTCFVADASGTAIFPPSCPPDGFQSPPDAPLIGMGTAGPVEARSSFDFFDITYRIPGGPPGGEEQGWTGMMGLSLTGRGSRAGYNHFVSIPLNGVTHTGPRSLGTMVQGFDTDLFRMTGQITGDPDFDLLRITAGTDFGLPSPGHTTLTRLASGDWAVDSFFDITYRIDFVGAPGGPFAGASGSEIGTARWQAGVPSASTSAPGATKPGTIALGRAAPNPTSELSSLEFELPSATSVRAAVHDVAGRLVRELVERDFPAGRHTIRWDGRASGGRKVAAGIYFYKVRLGSQVHQRPIVMLR